MKVRQISICPAPGAEKAGRPALTPEQLAATFARTSRNNEGFDAIHEKTAGMDPDAAVDAIFNFLDYGHQSIADMVPVALYIEDISIWLAHKLWERCPLAGGQESSTRYIQMSPAGLSDTMEYGIPCVLEDEWKRDMEEAFAAYHEALALFTKRSKDPEKTRIPAGVSAKAADRMRRNYAFDRARYFLPVAAKTNMAMIQSAREWAKLIRYLASSFWPEAHNLADRLRAELELAAPRMLRHSYATDATRAYCRAEMQELQYHAQRGISAYLSAGPFCRGEAYPCQASLSLCPPLDKYTVGKQLDYHEDRYAPIGSHLSMMAVRFGWTAVAMAEIRDLNRHRTGSKLCLQVPRGFYCAQDQVEPGSPDALRLTELWEVGRRTAVTATELLAARSPVFAPFFAPYFTLLGTQYPFEHTTTADKAIYEWELRTGTGAHYRYADHCRQVLDLWYEQYPNTAHQIQSGLAEPE